MGGLLHQARVDYHDSADFEHPALNPMRIIMQIDLNLIVGREEESGIKDRTMVSNLRQA